MAQLSPSLHDEPLLTYDEATCLSPLPAVSAVPLEFFERVRYSTLNSIVIGSAAEQMPKKLRQTLKHECKS